MLFELHTEIMALGSPERAKLSQRFFKTGVGQYGEGDVFVGITVPVLRQLGKKYHLISLSDIKILLSSEIHEERLLALLLLVRKFQDGDETIREKIFTLYLKQTRYINNWDLVDSSASYIVGAFLFDKPKDILLKLATSKNMWERRIAIIATLYFIHQGNPEWTFKIAELLLNDVHDLIHKAVGWMLREVGKQCSEEIEERFLKKCYSVMPRTMLRYAIERFPEAKRKQYLTGNI